MGLRDAASEFEEFARQERDPINGIA